jgi:hypothetical protein
LSLLTVDFIPIREVDLKEVDAMAEPKPIAMDETWLEKLRHDPEVIHHRRTARIPFRPTIRVTGQVDVFELIGRYDDEGEAGKQPER